MGDATSDLLLALFRGRGVDSSLQRRATYRQIVSSCATQNGYYGSCVNDPPKRQSGGTGIPPSSSDSPRVVGTCSRPPELG